MAGGDEFTYTYETVAHEIDQNLFMTSSGKIVEGNFEIGDCLVVMHSDTRPMPVYKTRVEPAIDEEPPVRISDIGGKGKIIETCSTPVVIEYDTTTMGCGESQDLTAVGCGGPYVWELTAGGGAGGGALTETEGPREGMKHTEAGVSPSASDDKSDGYRPWSRWHNTVTNKYFVCVDDAEGEAVWVEYLPPPNGGLGNTIKYTSPGTNPYCNHNATIQVKDYYRNFPDPPGYPTSDEVQIAVNCNPGGVAYRVWVAWIDEYVETSGNWCNLGAPSYDCHYYRVKCGYDEYSCSGAWIRRVNKLTTAPYYLQLWGGDALTGWWGTCGTNCPVPEYCGYEAQVPCSFMGEVLDINPYHATTPCYGCGSHWDFCVGHSCGDIDDVRTPDMLAQGCCPEALLD